ncbi:MAG: ABC transporter permease [Desulfobacteraceae bacterium]|nr:ABC transporter permease [Desulfobacteraceae bacterium]
MSGRNKNSNSLGKLGKSIFNISFYRGVVAIIASLIFWEFAARVHLPVIGMIPAPSAVAGSLSSLIFTGYYWESWYVSFERVFSGFVMAQIIGIPVGLLMGMSRKFRDLGFPILEVLRPIPPLAWVPASVIFWPTPQMSMVFVTFLGAFFTTVLNILGGVSNIDIRYIRSARSFGASNKDIFWRIVLPATLPSLCTGMTVGMGITWEVVVAAEMIASRSGLGFLTWRSYVAGDYPVIVIGMISIGIAGYISSSIIRLLSGRATPWLKII